MIRLVTGGARSGKSSYAERLTLLSAGGRPALYIATASPTDGEMQDRIALHRSRRPENWRTEERWKNMDELELEGESAVLLDCIGFLLDNAMFELIEDWDAPAEADAALAEERVKKELDSLVFLCRKGGLDLVMVTNEVGDGLVPPAKISRLYRDALGRINCHAAALADKVSLVVCGIPVEIK